MSNEKRLIDVNDALDRLRRAEPNLKVVSVVGVKAVSIDAFIHFLESRKTVDAVEVVRCRDCIYRHIRYNCQGRRMDFFCADGKRVGGYENG
jgi:hypothetical protein